VIRALRGVVQLQLYLAVCLAPLVFALLGDRPPGRPFLVELSVALGFVGLAILGLQVVVTSRVKDLAGPYGMDVVIAFHRQMSTVGFALILAHPTLLLFTDIDVVALLDVRTAPWRARFGVLAVVAMLVLVVTSVWRERLRIPYETWKVAHGVLAVVVVGAGLGHVVLVGHHVADPWKQALWAVMSAALLGALGWVRIVQPILTFRKPWEVTSVDADGDGTWTVRLRPVGHDGLRFQPGQFAWLIVGGTPFATEEHPFSFSSSAEERPEVCFTIKELGDWTSEVGEIEPGTRAYVDGPHGSFSPDRAEGPGFALIAGGVGITPILSILRTFRDRHEARPVVVVYGGSTMEELVFLDEIREIGEELDLTLVPVPEDPPPGWAGESGFVDADLLDRHLPHDHRDRWQVFVCGPPPMLDAVERALDGLGVPADHVHAERFQLA
jgi:predicted ferric reductase